MHNLPTMRFYVDAWGEALQLEDVRLTQVALCVISTSVFQDGPLHFICDGST